MNNSLQKRSILYKTVQVGSSTLASRFLGIIREYLMVKYLGIGPVSDAFFTAFKIPNSLRKIFAEGALSAAFIPTFVGLMHEKDRTTAHRLMTLAFIFFEGIVLTLSLVVMWKAEAVLRMIAPGFSPEQTAYAVPYLRIMMPFILFISSSALLAGALQSAHHFLIPALSSVLLNIVFIGGLLLSIAYQLPVTYFCVCVLIAGILQFVLHSIAYFRFQFSFSAVSWAAWHSFKGILKKFIPCTIAMSVMEVSLFIDTSFASYLPAGSISLIHYANRFVGIPLGVFAVALSTILLPHFSRINTYAPSRLSFYILESAKVVFWVTIPITGMMALVGKKIFSTLFLSEKFTMVHVEKAHMIFIAFLIGLFFFSFNKIVVNIYYARHNTLIPTIVALSATIIHVLLNIFFMRWWGAAGLALATSLSIGCLQTILLVSLIPYLFGFKLYFRRFFLFVVRYLIQVATISSVFACLIYLLKNSLLSIVAGLLSSCTIAFFQDGVGFWFLVFPCGVLFMLMLFITKRYFGVKVHFLE